MPLPPAVILSGSRSEILRSKIVERPPNVWQVRLAVRKPSPLWGRWAIRFANWSDEGILPQGNTHRPVAFGESPHPSRRLLCYAKRKRSAIRQPRFKGNLSAQASRHLPHKGEGFLFRQRLFIAEGDSSTSLRMTAGGNGSLPNVSANTSSI